MLCEDVLERLSAFLDDELDPLRSREIQQHLGGCPGCTRALEQMKALAGRLREEAPYYRAPDSLRARVSRAAWSDASRGRVPCGSRLVGRRGGRPGGYRRHLDRDVPSAGAGGVWLNRAGSGIQPYPFAHGEPSDRRRLNRPAHG